MELKGCSQCPVIYPASTDFFYKLKSGRNGLHPWCKECFKKGLDVNRAKKKDMYAQMKSRYYEANKEKLLGQRKQWARDNVQRVRVIRIRTEARRRARITETPMHTEEEWNKLVDYYGRFCIACYQPKKLTRDHIIPVAHGGTNEIQNMQPLCRECNSSKGTKTLDYRFWFMVA